jgi:hypothetical protein
VNDDARSRPAPRRAAAPEPRVIPTDTIGDSADGHLPIDDDELFSTEDDAGYDVGEPWTADEFVGTPYQAPWWVVQGEQIDATALSNRKSVRERHRSLGAPAGYDTFWGHVDVDPASVVPTVQTAKVALAGRDFALQRLRMPWPLTPMIGVVVAAAAPFGIVGGSSAHRLAAFATSMVFGLMFAIVVRSFAIPFRLAATGAAAAAVACVAVSAVPAIHGTRWYGVLVGLAFAGAGLVVAALWPIAQAWRIEQNHWRRPDVARASHHVDHVGASQTGGSCAVRCWSSASAGADPSFKPSAAG